MDREKFFQKFKPVRKIVPVPLADGEEIHVRELTANELSRLQNDSVDKKGNPVGMATFRERLVVACACNAEGVLVFTSADVAAIGALPSGTVEPIVVAAQKLNRFGETGDVEDAKKN